MRKYQGKFKRSCLECASIFRYFKCQEKTAKYCSLRCRAKGVGSRYAGENNNKWKGDSVGYVALHDWVARYLGKPRECEECGTKTAKKYEWANTSGEYKRDLKDWIRLCTSCHRYRDGHSSQVAFKAWVTRRARYGNSGKKYATT